MQSGIKYHVTRPDVWRTITQRSVMRQVKYGRSKEPVNEWDIREIFEGTSIREISEMIRAWVDPGSISPEDLKIIYRRLGIGYTDQLRAEGVYAQ